MDLVFHKQFKKKFKKLPAKIKRQFYERIELFSVNKNHEILNNHSLEGSFEGCRSINISGDYRAIFKEDLNISTFIIIGTHSELY
jgi:addiction module RelE/StbE family toxin